MKQIFFFLTAAIFLAGCSKDSSGTATNTTATTHQYGSLGGSCYDYTASTYVAGTYCSTLTTTSTTYNLVNGICYASTGAQVATAYCTSTTSGYFSSNGLCYSSSTYQQVATGYCTSATATTGNVCYGTYIYSQNGTMQYVVCSGTNCRGYTLIQVSTGTSVTCQ